MAIEAELFALAVRQVSEWSSRACDGYAEAMISRLCAAPAPARTHLSTPVDTSDWTAQAPRYRVVLSKLHVAKK